jgi:MFS family permease
MHLDAQARVSSGHAAPATRQFSATLVTTMTLTGFQLLPAGTLPDANRLFAARALRAFVDGYIALLLPYYLTLLGYNPLEIGILITATLLGSGAMTLIAGLIAHRYRSRSLLAAASLLMAATGIGITLTTGFWPLLIVAFVGTINPSNGDVSVFLPLEQTLLTHTTSASSRTALFARYSLIAALAAAIGAQAAALPALVASVTGIDIKLAIQAMFLLYGAAGLATLPIYRSLSPALEAHDDKPRAPLEKSKRVVYKLAALFSLDAFGGGFAVQSLLALWLFQRFGLSVAEAASLFLWTGILAAFSQLAAARIAARFGLINTMVFTHLPANVLCMLIPFMPTLPLVIVLLFLRAALSSMDVPARVSYVMAVVSPAERPAAASITNVPRSLASALSPALAGYMLAVSSFGWPLVVCGGLKIAYDLTLLKMFQSVKPLEENVPSVTRENT